MLRRFAFATWLLLFCQHCGAAEWKPVAVVSFSGWKELQADLGFLGQLVQSPDLAERLGKALTVRSGVQNLEGLDDQRPWGALVQTDGLRITPLVFVPVSDLGQLLRSLAPLMGPPQEESPGIWKIGEKTLTGFVREKDGWAWLAQTPDVLQTLPDPAAVLGESPAKFDLAVSFYPANLPEAFRTLAIDELRSQKLSLLKGRTGDNEPSAFPLLGPLAALPYESTEEFFTDVRRLTLGWTLDRQQKLASLDVSILPIEGSPAEQRWNARPPATSVFRPKSADNGVSLELSLTSLPRAEYSVLSTQYFQKLLDQAEVKSTSQRKLALAGAEALGVLLDEAAQAENPDAVVRVFGKSPPYAIVAAARLRDAGVVEQRIKQLAAAAEGKDSLIRVKPDVARLGSIRVHSIEIVGAKDKEPLRKLLGPELTIYLATSGPHAFLACGNRALAAIEKSLPAEEAQPIAAVEFSLRLGAALTAYARTTSQQEIVPILTLVALSLQASDDRLIFTADANQEGLRARLQCREAVLRAAALGLNLAAQQMIDTPARRDSSPARRDSSPARRDSSPARRGSPDVSRPRRRPRPQVSRYSPSAKSLIALSRITRREVGPLMACDCSSTRRASPGRAKIDIAAGFAGRTSTICQRKPWRDSSASSS